MGLIGAGTWGRAHASLYSEDHRVEFSAVCDVNEGKAAALAGEFGLPADRVFADHRAMLRCAALDAVAIVTPDFAHAAAAIDCANAGKHLLIEKPIATTREDALAIRQAVHQNGVRAMVDFHNRWNPPFALMKERVDAGEIGAPVHAYCRLNDIRWVATDLLPWAAQSSILWFLGSHSLDTLRWVFRDEVRRVYALSRSGILASLGVDTVDVYQTLLEFRNGGIATMENGWITPNGNLNINDFKFNVMGEHGMFSIDQSGNNLIQMTTDRTSVPDVLVNNFVHGRAAGFAYQSIRDFVDRLLDGKPFGVSVDDAVNVTFTLCAVLESARLRQPVDVVLPAPLCPEV